MQHLTYGIPNGTCDQEGDQRLLFHPAFNDGIGFLRLVDRFAVRIPGSVSRLAHPPPEPSPGIAGYRVLYFPSNRMDGVSNSVFRHFSLLDLSSACYQA
jgi:hypothetical protein